MQVTRIFTGPDGRSHFQDLDIATNDVGRGLDTGVIPAIGAMVRDRRATGPLDMDFHCAPRRQLVIAVGGGVEVSTGDGSLRRFGPGDIVFADDLAGEGHKTRSLDGLSHMVFIHLADDFDPAVWGATPG
jgi:hypothetical protein